MPYAPTERYNFNPLLIGATEFGRGIGDAIAGSRERASQQEEELKRENAAYKGLVSYAANAGLMPKEQAELMSKPELEGALRGLVLRQESERLARDEERKNLETLAKMNEGRAEASALQGLGQFFSTPQVPMKNPPALDLQSLAAYAQQNPQVANTKAFAQLADVAKAMQPKDGPQTLTSPWGENFMVVNGQVVRAPKAATPPPLMGRGQIDPLTGEPIFSVTGNPDEVRSYLGMGKPGSAPIEAPDMGLAPAGNAPAGQTRSGAKFRVVGGQVPMTEDAALSAQAASTPAPAAPAQPRVGQRNLGEVLDYGLNRLMTGPTDAERQAATMQAYQRDKQAILTGGFTPEQKQALLMQLFERYKMVD